MAKALPYGLIFCFSGFVSWVAHAQVGHESYVHVTTFILGWFGLLALGTALTWLRPEAIKLNPVFVVLCFLPLLGSEPLFENDQYRYFWEGKVLSEGFNPWRTPPAAEALDGIDFPERDLVGFNKLTSPYSPLAVVYHALFAQFSYSTALLLLQLVNALLCAGIFFLLSPLRPVFVIGIAGILGKEFVQSVHIDLLVWLFFWLAMTRLKAGALKTSAVAFVLSSLFKVNILLMFPWFFCAAFRSHKVRGVAIYGASLLVSLVCNGLGPLSFHDRSGLVAFMQHWVWHSGILGLWEYFGGLANDGIFWVNVFWMQGIAALGLLCLFKSFEGWRWSTIVYTFNALLRPAFNGWYFPWFGLSAALAGQELALIYGFMSPLAYVKYAAPTEGWLLVFILATHFFGSLYLFRQVIIKK